MFIEEEVAKIDHLISLYNELNKTIFNGSLAEGVKYNKADEDSYGPHKIGLQISSTGKAIGDATWRNNFRTGKCEPIKIRISKQFDFVTYDEAVSTDGQNTMMGILLHEIAHHLVISALDIREVRQMYLREKGHGPTFKKYVKSIQDKLDTRGINIKIPADETADVKYAPIQTKGMIIIFKVKGKGYYLTDEAIGTVLKEHLETNGKEFTMYSSNNPSLNQFKIAQQYPVRSYYPFGTETDRIVNEIIDGPTTSMITDIALSEKSKVKAEKKAETYKYLFTYKDNYDKKVVIFLRDTLIRKMGVDVLVNEYAKNYRCKPEEISVYKTNSPEIDSYKVCLDTKFKNRYLVRDSLQTVIDSAEEIKH